MTARELVKALGGRWHGSYGMISCPVPGHGSGSGDPDPSLKVSHGEDGPRFHCFAACDWRDVKAELRRQGLLPEWHPGTDRRHKRSEPQPRQQPDRQAVDARRIAAARAIWRRAQPIAGTVGELYLRQRAIALELPPTLRYLPGLEHKPTGQRLPALIAAVQGPDGRVSGIHRIFLRADGHGVAPVTGAKMMLGQITGSAVRLAPAASRLGIAEGVENGLCAMQLYDDLPVWAGLSVSNIAKVELPPIVREVVLLLDGDAPGSAAEKAAAKATLTLMNRGLKVETARPPENMDFNDIVRAGTRPRAQELADV